MTTHSTPYLLEAEFGEHGKAATMIHDHNCQTCGARWECGNEACPDDDTCPDCGHKWEEQDEKIREEEEAIVRGDVIDPDALCVCGCPIGAHVNDQGYCRICDCEEAALPEKEGTL